MSEWNPWHGCKKISEGCRNCYVYRRDAMYDKDGSEVYKTKNFDLPVRRKRDGSYKLKPGETVFTCFTSDFFLDAADEWREEAWDMIRKRRDLDFFIVTKRIDRLGMCIPDDWGNGYPNIVICCTAENQEMADYRLPIFSAAPISRKEIICEPLLGKIDLRRYLSQGIKQVTVGGESGDSARICDYDWVLSLRDQCKDAKVSFHFKQTGAKFRMNGKVYSIPRSKQLSQAKKAGIDLFFE